MKFPKKTFKIISILFLISFSKSSLAINIQKAPVEVSLAIENPRMVGFGEYTFFGFKIYDIVLWNQTGRFNYRNNMAINIEYNKSFSKDDLIDKSIDEIKRNYEMSDLEEATFRKYMERTFLDIEKGDTKTAIFFPDEGLSLYHNSKFTGTIEDSQFARKFIDIWLHDKSSDSDLTKKLKGNYH